MAISWNEVGAKTDDWGAPKITKTAATLQKAQQNYYAQAQKEEEERRANNRQIMKQIENEATANRITGIPTAKAGSTLIGTPGIASVAVGMAEKKEEQRQTAIIGTAARLETLGVTEKEARKTLKESQKGEGTWLGKTAASAATDTASGYLGGLGGVFGVLESAAMGFKKVSDEDRKAAADTLRADATKQQYTVTQLQRQLSAAQPGSAEYKQLSKQLREAQQELQRKNSLLANVETFVSEAARETANKLQTKSAEQKQAAYEKAGNTKFGKIATDVTSAGLGMVFDAAAGLATGVTPLTSAAIRAAGSANLEAKNEGATEASAAVRGGLEFLKVSAIGRLSNVSGIAQKFSGATGSLDDIVNAAVGKLAAGASSNPAIQKGLNYLFTAIASGAGEGAEEMIEDIVDPMLDAISRLDKTQLSQFANGEFWVNALYSGLVGAVMGLAGGALDVGNIKTPESVTGNTESITETPETVSQSKAQPMGNVQIPTEAKTAQRGEIQAKADEFNALVREYSNRLETAKNEGYDAAELKWLQDTEAELTRRRAELDELQKNKTTPEVGAENDTLLLPEVTENAIKNGLPLRKDGAVYKIVEIPQTKIDEISAYVDTMTSADTRKKFKQIIKDLFMGNTYTNANTVAKNLAYQIKVGSKGLGEIIARQPVNSELLAMLEQLDEVVENAKYMASEPTSHPEKRGIERTDIFHTDVMLGKNPAVAKMRVNVGKDGNNLYFMTNEKTDSNIRQPQAGESRQSGIGEAPSANVNVSQRSGEVNREETSGSGYGTKAIQKLGININKPLAGYDFVESAVSNEKAARRAIRDLNRKMNELNPTAKEKRIAEGLADGTFDETDIPASVNKNKVLELADYIAQKDSFDEKKLKYRKEDMKFEFEDKLDKLFEREATWKKRNAGALKLNTNTMERNFLNVAGDADGKALNEELYYPVVENEAERIRFVNRMFDRVRDFHLNKNESELVQLVIEGRAAGDIMAKLPPNEQTTLKAAAEGSVEDFPELSSQQKKIVEDYKRWLDTQARVDSPDVDADKVNKAADAYSAAYADFYTAINDFLVAHGYEPIGFIKGYAPHMQTEETKTGIAKLLDRLGVGMDVTELPTEIAGRTESFKPGKQWNPHFLPRRGDKTVYDAVSGYENYVNYISNVFYHTDDIQKLRITSNYLRDRYASDEIRERISQARYMLKQNASVQNEYLKDMKVIERGTQLSADDARAKILEYIDSQWTDRKNLTKYGDFVSVLDDYANVLAGKQTKLDRSFESFFGRNILNVGRKIEQTFAKSSVVGNLSSALNQTAQLPMLMSEVGAGNTYQAIWDIVRGELNKVNFDTQSDFITGKQQIDYLKDAEGFEKVLDAAAIPFNAVDDFASRLVVRAKYLEQVKQGKTHEQAIKEADRYANRLIGSRLKGAKPIVFESKNPLVKLVTTFQLEIANGWAHISRDMPRSVKEIAKTKGTKAAAAAVGGVLAKYLITAFLANRLSEDIYGGTPAPYDIVGLALSSFAAAYGVSPNEYLKTIADDVLEKVTGERGFGTEELGEADVNAGLEELRYNALGDVPYLNNVLSLLDLSDSRLPLPKLTDSAFKSGKAQLEAAETPEERAAALYNMGAGAFNIATSWLPLGNQIKKTAQGAELIARGGKYSNYGENEQLNYPVDFGGVGGTLTGIKALLFGPNSLSQAEEYWSTEKRKLTTTQTDAYQGAVNAGADKEAAYSLIDKMRGAEKTDTQSAAQVKSRMLLDADIPGLAKGSIYYFTLANDKEKALMDAFSESGTDIGEVTKTLIEIKNAEDSNSKRYYIAEADLTDYEKQQIYTALISDSHGNDIYRIMSAGLSFNDYLFIQNEYTDINNRNLSAANKTLAFERWIDSEGFNKRQEQAIQNSFKFYSMTVADTEGKYDELTELGIGSDTAEQIIKKASIYDTTTTAEKVKFYREIINLVKGSSQQLKALTPYLSEGDLSRCTYATNAGISTAEWVTFKEEMLGRSTQAQTKAVLDSMVYLTNKERAVLWQMQDKSWKPSKNPYDYAAGKAAYDYMHEED